jgi:hypothetical protein
VTVGEGGPRAAEEEEEGRGEGGGPSGKVSPSRVSVMPCVHRGDRRWRVSWTREGEREMILEVGMPFANFISLVGAFLLFSSRGPRAPGLMLSTFHLLSSFIGANESGVSCYFRPVVNKYLISVYAVFNYTLVQWELIHIKSFINLTKYALLFLQIRTLSLSLSLFGQIHTDNYFNIIFLYFTSQVLYSV